MLQLLRQNQCSSTENRLNDCFGRGWPRETEYRHDAFPKIHSGPRGVLVNVNGVCYPNTPRG